MKPYRNIYIMLNEPDARMWMTGNLEIPYTGEIIYGIEDGTEPDGYNPEVDIHYRCHCDLEEIKEFKKVSNITNTICDNLKSPDIR